MALQDLTGNDITAASADAVAHLDKAVNSYLGLRIDPGNHLKAALTADPDLIMGNVLRGLFMLLFANRKLVSRAEGSLEKARDAAEKLGATERERKHIAALEAWCAGDARAAVNRWEEILASHPRDLIAMRMAHFWHFYFGDSIELRDSMARVISGWDETVPGYGFIEGCYGFGLEEAGDYEEAERRARSAVERNPEDIWAAHAVAHVMEMQGRPREGVDWITGLADYWGMCNNFAYHVWWHRALFWFEQGEFDTVLDLYDREVRADSTEDYLDISNGAAMLWRLEQEGVDVGGRWQELAERSAARSEDQMMVFADAHYMMAFAAAGEDEKAAALLENERSYAETGTETESQVAKDVGVALMEAIAAHRRGDYGSATDILLAKRDRLWEIGGSHAQRDVFHRTLIEAASAAGRFELARDLLDERLKSKPNSALSWRKYAGVLSALGDAGGAAEAETKAEHIFNG